MGQYLLFDLEYQFYVMAGNVFSKLRSWAIIGDWQIIQGSTDLTFSVWWSSSFHICTVNLCRFEKKSSQPSLFPLYMSSLWPRAGPSSFNLPRIICRCPPPGSHVLGLPCICFASWFGFITAIMLSVAVRRLLQTV